MTGKELNQAGKFARKFLILVILFFIVDRLLGTWIEHAYNNVPQGDVKTFSHSITNPTEDIFIYGSSRAVHGYDCRAFTNVLGYSCFNNGRENSNILYHNAILNEMLKKHTPKIIILDVAPKELSGSAAENSKNVLANMILPYARRDTAFANIARELFPQELVKAKLSMLYAYKPSLLPLINGGKISGNEEIVNGYLPLHGATSKMQPGQYIAEDGKLDSTAKQALESFIKTVVEKNIYLYVIQSPIYVQYYPTSPSLEYIKTVLKKYNVPFWNYAFDTAFYKPQFFYDNIHLNDSGAAMFSKAVALRIQQNLDPVNIHPR
jgi:hypothetical protein